MTLHEDDEAHTLLPDLEGPTRRDALFESDDNAHPSTVTETLAVGGRLQRAVATGCGESKLATRVALPMFEAEAVATASLVEDVEKDVETLTKIAENDIHCVPSAAVGPTVRAEGEFELEHERPDAESVML